MTRDKRLKVRLLLQSLVDRVEFLADRFEGVGLFQIPEVLLIKETKINPLKYLLSVFGQLEFLVIFIESGH